MGSAMEECRAESVGLFLSLEEEIHAIFGHTGDDVEKLIYVNWLSLLYGGLNGLEMWDPNRGWLQAHSQVIIINLEIVLFHFNNFLNDILGKICNFKRFKRSWNIKN